MGYKATNFQYYSVLYKYYFCVIQGSEAVAKLNLVNTKLSLVNKPFDKLSVLSKVEGLFSRPTCLSADRMPRMPQFIINPSLKTI